MTQHKNTNNKHYFQHTIKDSFTCVSNGLHTGLKIVMRVTPGEENSGIVFIRRDVEEARSEIKANWKNVSDTRLSTTISNNCGVRVSTIEHLMAALYACEIDNARIILDGPEVPIMDGSSASYVKLIRQVGVVTQAAERKALLIKQPVFIQQDDKLAAFFPSPTPWIDMEIDFNEAPIGKQRYSAPLNSKNFEDQLCSARTFGFKEQIDTLHKLGLAQGGSMQNAIVIDNNKVVNKEGLRFHNEFVRHKVLDSIGDIALISAKIMGKFRGVRCGHEINNAIIHKLMSEESAYKYTTVREAEKYSEQILKSKTISKEISF